MQMMGKGLRLHHLADFHRRPSNLWCPGAVKVIARSDYVGLQRSVYFSSLSCHVGLLSKPLCLLHREQLCDSPRDYEQANALNAVEFCLQEAPATVDGAELSERERAVIAKYGGDNDMYQPDEDGVEES